MKRWMIVAGALVVLAAIIAASLTGGGPKGEKVYTEPAATRTIESIVSAPGEIDPKVKVNISAHIVGKIERLYFVEGDAVKRGQKIVDLEKHIYVAQRDRLLAELAGRRVEVQRAHAALNTARASLQRAQSLSKQGIQAQELFEQTRLGYDNATAGLAAAEEGVRQTAAGLRQAEEDLSRTTIVSPIDGRVVQLNAHEGEVVVTGTMNNPGSVIAVIADLSEILVEAEVGETEVVAVRVGQEARVKIDAVADKEYHGRVVEIGSSASVRQQGAGSGIRYFKVKVAVADADERLRPGMSAQVAIVTSTAAGAVSVPIQAVMGAQNKKHVFLVRDGKAKLVEVTAGISDATHVAVLKGLAKGDPVITGPFRTLKKLKDKDPVIVTKETPTKSKDEEDE
jgi:HlyD family secretion protein